MDCVLKIQIPLDRGRPWTASTWASAELARARHRGDLFRRGLHRLEPTACFAVRRPWTCTQNRASPSSGSRASASATLRLRAEIGGPQCCASGGPQRSASYCCLGDLVLCEQPAPGRSGPSRAAFPFSVRLHFRARTRFFPPRPASAFRLFQPLFCTCSMPALPPCAHRFPARWPQPPEGRGRRDRDVAVGGQGGRPSGRSASFCTRPWPARPW